MDTEGKTTHFGFEKVAQSEKVHKVKEVFNSVANKYDVMNDLMSFGLHRLWKQKAVNICNPQNGQTILDLAGGTGDLTKLLHKRIGNNGKIIIADINEEMLKVGEAKLLDQGICSNIEYKVADAQELPFEDNTFDRIIIGFGLRNVTRKDLALKEMYRCLKPAGKLVILEFSKPKEIINPIYDAYSFKVLPKIGKYICNDEASYRYLSESIRMHPGQEELKEMIDVAGFSMCKWQNLSAGIVAIHTGYKI